jgi:hypothetical protein
MDSGIGGDYSSKSFAAETTENSNTMQIGENKSDDDIDEQATLRKRDLE